MPRRPPSLIRVPHKWRDLPPDEFYVLECWRTFSPSRRGVLLELLAQLAWPDHPWQAARARRLSSCKIASSCNPLPDKE